MKDVTARLLPTGDGAAPFGLHLVLGKSADGDEAPVPLPLGSEGGATRVWLASVRGDAGSVVELAALKMLANAPAGEDSGAVSGATNRAMWDRFERERRRISELGTPGRFFPRLLQPDGGGGSLAELPPLLFCRTHRVFFEPPCPSCGGRLETCRDEGFLAESSLLPFAESSWRHLWCSSCAREDSRLAVWSFSVPTRTPRCPVGGPEELLAGISRSLLREWEPELVGRFADHACAEEIRSAREAGGISPRAFSQRWNVFSLCHTPFLVTALSPLRFDEWADVLGGRPVDALRPASDAAALASQAAARRISWFGVRLPDAGRLIHGSDGTGLDAVEILYLKLKAFTQVLRALVDFYRRTGQPHLDLHPEHVLVDAPEGTGGLPFFWGPEVRLHGLASSRPAAAGAGAPVLPPAEPVYPFAAPEVLEFHLASPRPSDLYVSGLNPAEGGSGYRLEGRLVDPNGLFPRPEPPDVVHATFPHEGLWAGPANLVLRLRPGSVAAYEEMPFRSDAVELDESFVKKLEKLQGVRFPGVRYKVFPRFGPAADIYSLGILLLRVLAAGEKDDFSSAVQGLGRLDLALKGARGHGSPAARLLAAGKGDETFGLLLDRSRVFYARADRQPGRPSALPKELWALAVALALRMCTRVPGFSFCSSPADWNPEDPASRIDEVAAETERLVEELQSILFDRQALGRELRDVLLEALEAEAPAPGGGAR